MSGMTDADYLDAIANGRYQVIESAAHHKERLRHIAARLRGDGEQGQAVAWQPIGTAPDNELVMVAIDKPGYSGMMFATYRDHQWYADDRDQTPFGGWTHWCPLPPMPSAALSTQPAPSEQVAASVAVPDEAIRQALVEGDFARAARLLGRPYAVAGRVVHGRQLGRTLGYPTANLRFGGKVPALRGIYATRVHGIGGDAGQSRPWPSVSSFGTRPTVDGVEPLLEAHLFDFEGDLYGRRIEVEFVARLRDEEKFPDLDSLVAQMDLDAAQARAALAAADDHPQLQPHHRVTA